jgi:PH/SEC7 domain-containing protein
VSHHLLQYRPGSALANKAENNWQRKSQFLLTELVKYKTYVDALQSAIALRIKRQGEKVLERTLHRTERESARTGEKSGPGTGSAPESRKASWKGVPDEETIEEGEEPPPTPMMGRPIENMRQHLRERAETED